MDESFEQVEWKCVGKVRAGVRGEWLQVRPGLKSWVHRDRLATMIEGAHFARVNAKQAPDPAPPVASAPVETKTPESGSESVSSEVAEKPKPKPKRRGRRVIKTDKE